MWGELFIMDLEAIMFEFITICSHAGEKKGNFMLVIFVMGAKFKIFRHKDK
jgi:hypothetical protein